MSASRGQERARRETRDFLRRGVERLARTSLHDPLPIARNAVVPISPLFRIVLPTSIGHGVPVASNEGLKSLNHHFLCPNLGVCQAGFPEAPSHLWGVFTDGDSPISPPGGGPQSWLFCPLISLALESIEIARGVSRWSTGSRHPVPDPQREFWCSTALEIIQMFSAHVQSLTHDSEVAQGLQHNWDGGEHLSARLQELCSPPHIISALCAWLVRQCDEFVSPTSGNVVVQRVPSPVSPPPPGPHPVPRPSRSNQPILSVRQRALLLHRNQPILSVRLLQQLPKCLVRRLLLPTRLWLCILVALQHLRATVVVDLSQKQDLHVSHGSLRCLWTIIVPRFGMGRVTPGGSLAQSCR